MLATTHNSKGEKTGVTKIIQNWKTQEGNTLKDCFRNNSEYDDVIT